MSIFDERQKEKNRLEDEMLDEAIRKLSGAVTGDAAPLTPENERLRMMDTMNSLGQWLNVSIPYTSNPDLSQEWYQEQYFRPGGVMWRTVQLTDNWYENSLGAMLARTTEDRLVALIPDSGNGYIYRDHGTGKKLRINKRIASTILPEATLYYRPLPPGRLDMKDVFKYIRDSLSASDYIRPVVIALIIQLFNMVTPARIKLLTSEVLLQKDLRLLQVVFLELILITAAVFFITAMKQLILSRIGTKAAIPLQSAFMMRLLTASDGGLKNFSSGDLGSRIGMLHSNIKMLVNVMLSTLLTFACSFVCLPQMFYYAKAPACVALAVTLVMILLYIQAIRKQIVISGDRLSAKARESGLTYSLIEGMRKITVLGAEKRAFAVWARIYRDSMQAIYDPPLFLKLFPALTPVILLTGTILTYWAAVRTGVSTADFYAFMSSYAILTGALNMIGSNAIRFANAIPLFTLLSPIMELEPEVGASREVVDRLKGNISIKNVTFRYDDTMPPVLENLNIEIKSGEYVAIVGHTGCGKSTILRLLLGFEKPDHGSIMYDGRDLKSLDLTSLRQRIGTVLQNGEVFQGTILSNITIAGTDLSEEDAWAAAEIAGIADDIRHMPMKMNTPLPSDGRGISGGQLQRLLIARAIAAKPRILYFDEATSALDNVTQKAVTDALGEMACTRLCIAHRLSTVKSCDRILCLDNGHIVEEGSYDELIEKNGFFAKLVKRQL